MTKAVKKLAKKVGLPPGTIVHIGNHLAEIITLSVIDYDKESVKVFENTNLKKCLISFRDPENSWIQIKGIHDAKMVETIGKHFGLHPLMLEDIVNSGQRPKLENYKDDLFIVLKLLRYNSEKNKIEEEQISLILGKNYLLSFTESTSSIFKPIEEHLKNKESKIRSNGIDYLCYSLIDFIVDNYFLVLEKFDSRLEELENALLEQPHPKLLQDIQRVKWDLATIRRCIWPVRETVNQFLRLDSPLIKDSTKLYMHDVYDHSIRAIDIIEAFRDISAGLLEIYLSNINLKLSEIMKVLTVVSTTFVPLTFIVSFYGMNFENLPGLKQSWGFGLVISLMLLSLASMLLFFRKRQWI